MIRFFLLLGMLSLVGLTWGQGLPPATEQVKISGAVKTPVVLTVADLMALPAQKLPTTVITSHTGEKRSKARGLRGVAVAVALQNLKLLEEQPKLSSSFYFVFRAADGYQVVFSWNELFNARPNRQVFFVTKQNGQNLDALPERILTIAPSDWRTGRRYLKGLAEIQVFQVK